MEFLALAAIGIAVVIVLASRITGRGHADHRAAELADARSSLAIKTSDEARAIEWEHRFSATRTGLHMQGHRQKKRREE